MTEKQEPIVKKVEPIVKLNDCPLPLDYIAKKYDISRTTFWRWRKRGLECITVGAKIFVKESALIAFMQHENAHAGQDLGVDKGGN